MLEPDGPALGWRRAGRWSTALRSLPTVCSKSGVGRLASNSHSKQQLQRADAAWAPPGRRVLQSGDMLFGLCAAH